MEESLKIKGEWTAYSLSQDIKEDSPVVRRLRAIARGQVQDGEKVIRDLKSKKIITKVVTHTNLTPLVGRNVLARLLAGDTTYSGEINYIALGDGNTAFNNNSTQLNNEVFRKLVSDASHDDHIAYIDAFIESGDTPDGTYTEAGAFIDGTGSPDTGQPFSLVVQNFVKSGSMFISLKITLSQG
jgi:hypothetical protein